MINLSNEYKQKVISMFGDYGKVWLDTIPGKIEDYTKKLELSNLKLVSDLTYNILFFADSKKYGPVVLKIELPFKELTIRESNALKLNNGTGACNIYYTNIDDGIILLERLMPGYSLESEPDLETKIATFAKVASKFNIKYSGDLELPTYRSILSRSIDLAKADERFTDVGDAIAKADDYYKLIEDKDDNNYLIHSDMHCNNILKSADDWKLIDPHGFVGNKILDCAIFIQKELEKSGFTDENLKALIETVSHYTKENQSDLCISLYVNYILNLCWDIEVNFPKDHIAKCLANAEMINNYYLKNYQSKVSVRKHQF